MTQTTDKTQIITYKKVYPQIYAYTLDIPERVNQVKIGYTERQNVDDRIKEQLKTAAFDYTKNYQLLWNGSSINQKQEWFKDHQLHSYLKLIPRKRKDGEWFVYENQEQSKQDFNDYINENYTVQLGKELDYTLRDEQTKAVSQTKKYFEEHEKSEFLWNAKPRFGKTLTTYDLIIQMQATKILIVTNRPAIANSWYDDYEKFVAHKLDGFYFISNSDSLKNRPVISREDYLKGEIVLKSKGFIEFLSLQDLKGSKYFGGGADKLKHIAELEYDLLVIDEAHEAIETLKTEVAFDNINRKNTLHLSGTPFKALQNAKFTEEQIFTWSYEDEQKAKIEYSGENHNPYEELPEIRLFTYQLSKMIEDKAKKGIEIDEENRDYAFDLNEFFQTKDGKFIYEAQVEKWLENLTRNEKYPFSTEKLRQELKHTFWLLNRVESAKALKELLEKNEYFKDYKIILAAGNKSFEEESKNLSKLEEVKQAIEDNDKTITLSVGQLTTGITIPEWSAVLMLSNIKSPALYMQAAFRAQNPHFDKKTQTRKQTAYIFDFAPDRTLVIVDNIANDLKAIAKSNEKEENIKKLLNFLPVIGEDENGKMVELNSNQVLTIPKIIKSQEVVKRKFMSNLLFNVGNIFRLPKEINEIFSQMPQEKNGNKKDAQTLTLGEETKTTDIEKELKVKSIFGEKIYSNAIIESIKNNDKAETITKTFIDEVLTPRIDKIVEETDTNKKEVKTEIEKQKEIIKTVVEKEKANYNIKKAHIDTNDTLSEEEKNKKLKHLEIETQNNIVKVMNQAPKTILENLEINQNEKIAKTNEDEIRSRLRGFSRTIPMLVFAYGDKNLALENFENYVPKDTFKELTNITIEQFKMLRDGGTLENGEKFEGNLFDTHIFNQSIKEFLILKEKLKNYFDETQEEDIFNYIPNQENNQIFTPKNVVKQMINNLEKETPNIFKDKTKKFLDPYTKSGMYLAELTKKLYQGLETEIPDEKERIKHILETQIYGLAPSEIIEKIAKNYVYGISENTEKINIKHYDLTNSIKNGEDTKEKIKEVFHI